MSHDAVYGFDIRRDEERFESPHVGPGDSKILNEQRTVLNNAEWARLALETMKARSESRFFVPNEIELARRIKSLRISYESLMEAVGRKFDENGWQEYLQFQLDKINTRGA